MIEYNNLQGIWVSNTEIGFNDDYNRYRIKPAPKLVPFTFEDRELFKDKFICEKSRPHLQFRIIGLDKNNSEILIKDEWINFEILLKQYQFEDGSPCGKYINE